MAGGRPKFQFDVKEVEDLASRGLTNEEIAISLGISEQTLYKHKRENIVFLDAIKKGQAKAKKFVANKLFKKISDEDTTSIIFYLKCHGWHEKTKEEVTVKGDHVIKVRFCKNQEEVEKWK